MQIHRAYPTIQGSSEQGGVFAWPLILGAGKLDFLEKFFCLLQGVCQERQRKSRKEPLATAPASTASLSSPTHRPGKEWGDSLSQEPVGLLPHLLRAPESRQTPGFPSLQNSWRVWPRSSSKNPLLNLSSQALWGSERLRVRVDFEPVISTAAWHQACPHWKKGVPSKDLLVIVEWGTLDRRGDCCFVWGAFSVVCFVWGGAQELPLALCSRIMPGGADLGGLYVVPRMELIGGRFLTPLYYLWLQNPFQRRQKPKRY